MKKRDILEAVRSWDLRAVDRILKRGELTSAELTAALTWLAVDLSTSDDPIGRSIARKLLNYDYKITLDENYGPVINEGTRWWLTRQREKGKRLHARRRAERESKNYYGALVMDRTRKPLAAATRYAAIMRAEDRKVYEAEAVKDVINAIKRAVKQLAPVVELFETDVKANKFYEAIARKCFTVFNCFESLAQKDNRNALINKFNRGKNGKADADESAETLRLEKSLLETADAIAAQIKWMQEKIEKQMEDE